MGSVGLPPTTDGRAGLQDFTAQLTMPGDAQSGAGALGVHGALEQGAFLEREMLRDDISLDGRFGTNVDAIRGDVAFQVTIDGNGSCRDGRHARR